MSVVVTVLGCGASSGVPRVSNDWGACEPNNPKNRRTRCALLVEKTSENGCTTVLIDTGPDIRQQLLREDVRHIDAAVFTHAHADHLHGIDDLRAFWINTKSRVPVYMDTPTHIRAMEAFNYCFETPEGSSYPAILTHRLIDPDKRFTVEGAGGAIDFEPIPVVHGNIGALGFRFEDIAYIPDVSHIPEPSLNLLNNLDYLILDCLRPAPHPSHFSLEQALQWTDLISPKNAVFTNMNNDLDYGELSSTLPQKIAPAFDGLKIAVNGQTARKTASLNAG